MRYFAKRFKQPSSQAAEPLVRRFDDGREVCLSSPAGHAEYQRRKQLLWEGQAGLCVLPGCGQRMSLADARLTGGDWGGVQLRDDRLAKNSLVHKRCQAAWHNQIPAQPTSTALSGQWPLQALLLFVLGLASLLVPSPAAGQAANAAAISGQVVTASGTPAASARVRVCLVTAIGNPCSTASVSLYSDYNLTVPVANPLSTDSYGNYSVFTNNGLYLLQVTPQTGLTYNYYYSAGGSGTVTRITLTLPNNVFTVTGSPCTSNCALVGSLISQSANTVFAGPASGSPASPTFRALAAADLPTGTCTDSSGCPSSNFSAWPGLIIFGDSIAAYTGCTTQPLCFVSLLAQQTGGTLGNYAVSGSTIQEEPAAMYIGGPANPTQGNNPLSLEEGGKNDADGCTAITNCVSNSQRALITMLTHRGSNNIVPSSAATRGGTWATDAVYANALASTTTGSTLTFTITMYGAGGAIGVPYRAIDSNGGTASVTIDGVVQSAGIVATGTGAFHIFGTNGSIFENMYPVAAGTHTVVITVTSATSGSNLISIPDVVGNPNPAAYTNPPFVGTMEVIPLQNNTNPTWSAAINTMKQATATTLFGYGYGVRWLPINSVPFVNAFNNATYIANQPGASNPDGLSCAGSTSDNVHPNNCGHQQIFQAIQTDLNMVQGSATQLPSAPGTVVTTVDYTLTSGVAVVLAFNGATISIPVLPNTTSVTITNFDTAHYTNLTAIGGAALEVPIPATLPPLTSIIITCETGNWFLQAAALGREQPIAIKTTNYALQSGDGAIFVASGATITLPNGLPDGQLIQVLNIDATLPTTITPGSGATLGNGPTVLYPGNGVYLSNSGGNWFDMADTGIPVTHLNLKPIIVTSGNHTVVAADGVIYVSGGAGITLSAVASSPPNTVTVIVNNDASLSTAITGAVSGIPATLMHGQAIIVSNTGGNWFLVGNNGISPSACATCVTSASSLTTNQVMVGAGGQASATLGSLGTTTTVLHGNAAGLPTFGAVANADLTNSSIPINGTTCTLGSACTVAAAAGTLTGTTLAAGVTASSLTSFGASPTLVTPLLGTPTSGVITNLTGTCAACTANSSTSTAAISGMTSTQVAIAGSATTITSSKALAGSGAGITTGPTTSASGEFAVYTGTGGQIQDITGLGTFVSGSTGANSNCLTAMGSGGVGLTSYLCSIAGAQLANTLNTTFNGTNWTYTTNGNIGDFRLQRISDPRTGYSMSLGAKSTGSWTTVDTTDVVQWCQNAPNMCWINPGLASPTVGTVMSFAVNPVRTVDNAADVQITTKATGDKAVVLQATSGQTANMLEVQSNSGSVLASISAAGLGAFATGSTVNSSLICTAAGTVVGCPTLAVSNAITTATGGAGTGTVTCLSAACTNLRGTYSVAGGTFTTGNFLTLVWPTTTTAYVCTATMNGGTGFLGIGNDVATATGMNISAGVTILGVTVTVNYSCRP